MGIQDFLNRFKVTESKEYKEDQERIMHLHKDEKLLSYVEDIYKEDSKYIAMVIFVKGIHKIKDQIRLFDCHGLQVGVGCITDITIGSGQEKDTNSEAGEKGQITFKLLEGEEQAVILAQYIV